MYLRFLKYPTRDVGKLVFNLQGSYGAVILPTTPVGSSTGLAMTQLTSGRVYQRSTMTGGASGKGEGSISASITLTAAANSIEYRLRDAEASGNPVLKDWTTATTNVPASTTSVICTAIPADVKKYFLDLRANGDNAQIVLGTSPVMMGGLDALSGQSQAVRQLVPGSGETIAALGVAVSPYGMVYATYSDGSYSGGQTAVWALPTDPAYGSTYAAEFLRRRVAETGVARGLIAHAVGATAIAAWAPGSANNVKLRAILDAVGGFESFYWHQGGDDAGAGTTKATYKTALDAMFADITAHNAIRGANYAKVLTAMATRLAGGAGTTSTVTAIRQAHKEWCAANSGVYLEPHDITLADNVHQNQSGSITLAQHVNRALASSDIGPTFGTPTLSTDNATLYIPINLPTGATTLVLTSNAKSRLSVFPTGTQANPLTISSLTYDDTNKRLVTTLSAAATTNVDVYAFLHPDPSGTTAFADMIRDNRTDGDGITVGRSLEPTTSGPVTATVNAVAQPPAGSGGTAVGDVFLLNTYSANNVSGATASPTTATGWNNVEQGAAKSTSPVALKNTAGGTSPLTVFITNATTIGNVQDTGSDVTPFPKSVVDTFCYADKNNVQGGGASSLLKATIGGVPAGTTWKVEVFGYRNNVASRLQNMAIGSTTISGDVGTNNKANITATFTGVVPASGLIDLSITHGTGEQYAYLNGMRLTRTA